MKSKSYDVLIIGGGLAGLYVALNLKTDLSIAIVVKDTLQINNSSLAQGGIAATLSQSDDVLIKHIEDTFKAGSNINDSLATKTLVYEAKENVEKLIEYGVEFDTDKEGNLLLAQEGGHRERRILRAGGDATGKEVMRALKIRINERKNIDVYEYSMATDLIVENNECVGATIIDNSNNLIDIIASKTVIATGGLGAIYKNTTNPKIATGDGIAMASRAGVICHNLEFIQFHPTGFYSEKPGQKFLISEAVRGEGAKLLNIEYERFMQKYDSRLELAPRDIVSQSIYREMYDTWSDHVYLDIRHQSKEFLMERFPTIYEKLKENGIYMEKDLIPVAPVEHFSCGGIQIDIFGRTSLKNLYANGECACSGVHGANRLASNSLLECIVFGRKIAIDINEQNLVRPNVKLEEIDVCNKRYDFKAIRVEIRDVMEKYVGIVRSSEGLALAKKIISKHYNNLSKSVVHSHYYYETLNMATTSLLIIDAAINRKESLGCHYRID